MIKVFMMRSFYSTWICGAVVFLLHQKSWWDESESESRDLTEDILVEICGVSWLSWE